MVVQTFFCILYYMIKFKVMTKNSDVYPKVKEKKDKKKKQKGYPIDGIIFTSTPTSTGNYFYELWTAAMDKAEFKPKEVLGDKELVEKLREDYKNRTEDTEPKEGITYSDMCEAIDSMVNGMISRSKEGELEVESDDKFSMGSISMDMKSQLKDIEDAIRPTKLSESAEGARYMDMVTFPPSWKSDSNKLDVDDLVINKSREVFGEMYKDFKLKRIGELWEELDRHLTELGEEVSISETVNNKESETVLDDSESEEVAVSGSEEPIFSFNGIGVKIPNRFIKLATEVDPKDRYKIDPIHYEPECNRYAGWAIGGDPDNMLTPEKVKDAYLNYKDEKEMVNHPSHYGGADNPYEVCKVLEAWGLDKDFYLGNVIKYIARAGKKDAVNQELKKAAWYLERRIKTNEAHEEGTTTNKEDTRA